MHQFSLGVEREIGCRHGGRGALRRHARARHLARRRLQPGDRRAGRVPRRLPARAAERVPGAGRRTGFEPAFNPAIPGSQPLTVITQFGGGSLTNATVRNYIQTGQAGALADFYLTSAGAAVAAQARAAFSATPASTPPTTSSTARSTDYHALQLELRRRFRNGIFWQVNYTFAKNAVRLDRHRAGRFEPFLDNARPGIERTRSEFHITHVINANAILELPFGEGKPWLITAAC